MKKLSSKVRVMVLATIVFMGAFLAANAETVQLSAGTAIPMVLMETINGKDNAVGQQVNFRVTSDIKVGNRVVIPQGAIARGQITRAKKNGAFGQPGEVQVTLNSVAAVDGTQVILTGGTLYDEGKNKLVLSVFLCFLLKGGNGELTAGMEVDPVAAGNTEINL